jgi:cell division protein ZipA
MDGYLRLILLVVAAIIVSFILFESWYRRRQAKQALFSTDDTAHISINADEILGLDPREPTMNLRMPEPLAESHPAVQAVHRIESSPRIEKIEISETRSNEAYANKTYANPVAAPKPQQSLLNDLLVISVVAEPGMQFGSYDLLQAITSTGLQYGDMNIFHYQIGNEALFSLSSANEPGDFDLDRMGDFFCDGLTLFTNLRDVSNPEQAFDLMLNSAEQLAEDLGGELRAGTRKPWTEEAYQYYRNKVVQYQLTKSV